MPPVSEESSLNISSRISTNFVTSCWSVQRHAERRGRRGPSSTVIRSTLASCFSALCFSQDVLSWLCVPAKRRLPWVSSHSQRYFSLRSRASPPKSRSHLCASESAAIVPSKLESRINGHFCTEKRRATFTRYGALRKDVALLKALAIPLCNVDRLRPCL